MISSVAAAVFAGFLTVSPTGNATVVDTADLFTPSQESRLEVAFAEASEQSGLAYMVETIPTLNDESIESISLEHANGFSIGDKEKDNGIFILIAAEERQVRIELADGVADYGVTELFSEKVMDEAFIPNFKEKRYFGGVITGVDMITEKVAVTNKTAKAGMVYSAENSKNIENSENVPQSTILNVAMIVVGFILAGLAVLFARFRIRLFRERREVNRNELIQGLVKNQTLRASVLDAENSESRKEAVRPWVQEYVRGDKKFTSSWFPVFMEAFLEAEGARIRSEVGMPSTGRKLRGKNAVDGKIVVRDHEKLADVIAAVTESSLEWTQMLEKNERVEAAERAEQAALRKAVAEEKAEKARKHQRQKNESAAFWELLDKDQRTEFKKADKSRKQEIVTEYGYDAPSAAWMVPMIISMFTAASNATVQDYSRPSNSSSRSSSHSSSNDTSTSSSSHFSGASYDPAPSSYDGGSSFSGGGDTSSF